MAWFRGAATPGARPEDGPSSLRSRKT